MARRALQLALIALVAFGAVVVNADDSAEDETDVYAESPAEELDDPAADDPVYEPVDEPADEPADGTAEDDDAELDTFRRLSGASNETGAIATVDEAVTRYEFISELVHSHDDHKVVIYRGLHTSNRDKGIKTYGHFGHAIPTCATVDNWYLSINDLPFWPVSVVHHGEYELKAACDFTFKDWPKGKNIRDEVPDKSTHLKVVFSKEKPADAHLYQWETDKKKLEL